MEKQIQIGENYRVGKSVVKVIEIDPVRDSVSIILNGIVIYEGFSKKEMDIHLNEEFITHIE